MKSVLYIAWRYAFSKNKRNAINIINSISSLVLIIGAASLIIITSGFNGLKKETLLYVNSLNPDMIILPKQGKTFQVTNHQIEKIESLEGVETYTQILEDRVLLNFKNRNFIAYLKGVDKMYSKVTSMDEYVNIGHWIIKEHRCVIGGGIAKSLGLGIFDSENLLKIVVPKPGMKSITSSLNLPYDEMFTVASGVYMVNDDFDKKYIFTDISKVRKFFNVDNKTVSSFGFLLKKDANESVVKSYLKDIFSEAFEIRNKVEQNVSLYKMLKTENLAIYFIFVLIFIVALFNLIGAIIMMIIEKKTHMRTLFMIGMQIRELRMIFFIQGIIVTIVSALIGISIGLLVCWGQMTFGWLKIAYEQPYPLSIETFDVVLVFMMIITLGKLASWIASSRLNKTLLTKK